MLSLLTGSDLQRFISKLTFIHVNSTIKSVTSVLHIFVGLSHNNVN